MSNFQFRSTVFILPGLGNSGDNHWQTLWEKEYGFPRINQTDWDKPVSDDWISTIEKHVRARNYDSKILLVGHSLACNAIARWSERHGRPIKGALLVAPSDTEAPTYPPGTQGFNPMPIRKLKFPSKVVCSSNDPYVSLDRAKYFADCWGSEFVNIGDAGHINVASGHGQWREGLIHLKALDAR